MSFNRTVVPFTFILRPSAVLAKSGVVNERQLPAAKICCSGSEASLIQAATGFGEISRNSNRSAVIFFCGGVYEECEEWLRFHSAGGDRRNPDAARLWACSGLHSDRDRNGSKRRCHTGRDSDGLAYGIRQQI